MRGDQHGIKQACLNSLGCKMRGIDTALKQHQTQSDAYYPKTKERFARHQMFSK